MSERRKVGEKEEHFLLSRGGLQHRRVTTFCFHSTVTTRDRFFFFFSVPSDKTNGPPYTIYSGISDFIIFQFCLQKVSLQKVSLQKGVELEIRIIRKDIFLLLSFFSSNVQQRFNSFYEFRRQGSDRTYVQFRLRFGRRNGRVHGRHVGAEVMRQLGHVIRAGHSLRYARHARHAGRAGTVGRYARDGGFRCR